MLQTKRETFCEREGESYLCGGGMGVDPVDVTIPCGCDYSLIVERCSGIVRYRI